MFSLRFFSAIEIFVYFLKSKQGVLKHFEAAAISIDPCDAR
ncbi:unknown protein [Simkania negevensis Z]|uniref:Uncharacterized protein n=1 Tax=Simkania negevensis (strain ATCC VR-1471 / DSM 27360 / Z) TaxID=331113 RepID=F8L4D0_SIMNZ|nr:unknown protein [Simkania negevensis Z]